MCCIVSVIVPKQFTCYRGMQDKLNWCAHTMIAAFHISPIYPHSGIISDSADSLFSYGIGESFGGFFDPGYTPAFGAVFSDPALEAQAQAVCGDDQFCMYDIATTGRIEIGQSTAMAGQQFEEMVMLSQPSKKIG